MRNKCNPDKVEEHRALKNLRERLLSGRKLAAKNICAGKYCETEGKSFEMKQEIWVVNCEVR